jgi:fructose-1-phosphate kinase PfkB-like protein
MITTVTLSPRLELELRVAGLTPGGVNPAQAAEARVYGCGMRCSAALRALGLPTVCLGISFDANVGLMRDYLERRCVAQDFAEARGCMRSSITVTDSESGAVTVLETHGDAVEPHVIEEYLKKLFDCAHRSRVVLFAGDIPRAAKPGGFDDIYLRSLRILKGLDALTFLDVPEGPLRPALKARPSAVRLRAGVLTRREAAKLCRDTVKQGAGLACCTFGYKAGARFAVAADANRAYCTELPPQSIFLGVSAEDAFAAGMAKALRETLLPDELLAVALKALSGAEPDLNKIKEL